MIKLSYENHEHETDAEKIAILLSTIKKALEEHIKSGKSLKEIHISAKNSDDGKVNIVLS